LSRKTPSPNCVYPVGPAFEKYPAQWNTEQTIIVSIVPVVTDGGSTVVRAAALSCALVSTYAPDATHPLKLARHHS
jgi:hypothetical protein